MVRVRATGLVDRGAGVTHAVDIRKGVGSTLCGAVGDFEYSGRVISCPACIAAVKAGVFIWSSSYILDSCCKSGG